MAGYSDFSMSNNAVAAYDSGLVPASKIKGVPAELVKQFCRYKEWHHSSKNFNRVEFYNPKYVANVFGLGDPDAADPAAVKALAEWKESRKSGPTIHHNCTVRWLKWSGSLRRPTCTERSAEGCTVSVKGQTATITLSSGTSFTKRLTTNGFSFKVSQ